MKRLYRNVAEAILFALEDILNNKKRSSRVLQKCIDTHPKWGSRDRKTFYDSVYEIIRWKSKYELLSESIKAKDSNWKLIQCWAILNDYELLDWKEFDSNPPTKKELENIEITDQSVLFAFPKWLFELGENQLCEKWKEEMNALNSQADISLRVNRILASTKQVASKLSMNFNIQTEKINELPDALILDQGKKFSSNFLHKKGLFEIQDLNSQRIAPFCMPSQGMKVIDLCAGAGGKALHLAALMRNKGLINAFDIEPNKIKELKKRANRANATIIKSSLLNENDTLVSCENWADVVLIDAPCSGLGTLKRNPEIKWKLNQETLNNYIKTQRELLLKGAELVKDGGVLVYATCSIISLENQDQIEWFLNQKSGKKYSLEAKEQIFAHQSKFDGFFMARMKKQEITK